MQRERERERERQTDRQRLGGKGLARSGTPSSFSAFVGDLILKYLGIAIVIFEELSCLFHSLWKN
jgi:hypothetical protein